MYYDIIKLKERREKMNKSLYRKYARVVVKLGANVRKDQRVIIVASTGASEFALHLQEEAYKAKAKEVTIRWTNSKATKNKYMYESVDTLSEIPVWVEEREKFYNKELPVMIYVEDSDPDAMAGVDNAKLAQVSMNMYKVMKKYRDERDNWYQWVIVAIPSKEWAVKVFPEDKPSVAVKKLWQAIIKCTRIDGKNPVKDWKEHIETLRTHARILNEYHFDYLEYKSKNGTDLKIKLHPQHSWSAAREKSLKKIEFTANMPTEEVFTMPYKNGVDGVVVSTKPLSLRGQLVENFKVYFKDGVAYKVEAEKGQEVLETVVNSDEGSKRLGEVALVPYDSPINQSGILFYNTLFDENASCHLAFGESFKDNIQGYEKMNEEDWKKVDRNQSSIHVDFMIGSKDLSIVGYTKEGKKVQIFKNGNWVI